MDDNEIAKMTGQAGNNQSPAYRLNEIRMSGDSGKFTLIELLSEKGEGGYPEKALGDGLDGVILKMRWRLFRYDEVGGDARITCTTEYDDKNTDKVVVYGSNEKLFAFEAKEKYQLNSQRVLYVYVPALKETVRVIVKASALSGEKNPGKEFGLFDYIDAHNDVKTYVHNFITRFGSVYREDPKNPRKSYYAMTFKQGRELQEEEKGKVVDMTKGIYEKTTANREFADQFSAAQEAQDPALAVAYPVEISPYPVEINPDDIPF